MDAIDSLKNMPCTKNERNALKSNKLLSKNKNAEHKFGV
ncbi:hypothetical protein VCR3J2_70229 [Vibrio coralliirubri]|uniref:Uncharacterized protein n=1 Tax=Vibrio coralliirubri TaxID=1516159 RepID=A0A0T7DW88_9VIBR|nr:hypothetical protein VCR4J2_260230 [Vibrio coralliirubri]CDT20942.1 hypothetical protein VCR1J2_220154 [Vibrio coralliirubri]CDT39581.1 hypothetical protein VCR26J2_150070 [Vibrio coralliirubri]CDT43965.1 hypothetical protein VCR6J2_440054 [Vibrio coralliirubri]CDT74022.1 hypothetical protein VCR29J2_450138 [Vibrio coralliirubri]